eukprot:Gb_30218 [translate_table: standard]
MVLFVAFHMGTIFRLGDDAHPNSGHLRWVVFLNAAYLEFCKATSITSLTVPEFSSICRVLCDQALLSLGQAREDRLRRVTLKVDESDVTFALQVCPFGHFPAYTSALKGIERTYMVMVGHETA